jgi:hypothetical protein
MTAFISRTGFKPVKHLTGAPYNGQANMYVNSGATSLVPGDVVVLAADGTAAGLPNATIATATGLPVGVVVGVVNAKFDPITGKMSNGSVSLDTPQVCAQNGIMLVADSPDLIFETEIATYAITGINTNHELVVTSYNTTTGASNMKIVYNGGEAADPARLLGVVQKSDATSTGMATPADADTNVKVLVTFNTHAYKTSAGVAGV